MNEYKQINSLTQSFKGIAKIITSPIVIENLYSEEKGQTNAIWDTGATNSVITETFAKKLNLIPSGKAIVLGVHGQKKVNMFPIKITLNNEALSFTIPVTECMDLTDDGSCEFLLGMDIISHGDLAITNFGGNTKMSFRVPFVEPIDFSKS